MESDGKIFVVVAVLALILVGVFVYMFSIDRKLTKMEKETEDKHPNKNK